MKQILLSKGKSAIVDDEDFEYLNRWKWAFDGLYAIRMANLGKIDGKQKYKKIYMHREINNTPDGLETDHINRNKLDNRRSNLRSVPVGQNRSNHDAHKNNATGICGVQWNKRQKRYVSRIVVNKTTFNLGTFKKLGDAIFARKQGEVFATELWKSTI